MKTRNALPTMAITLALVTSAGFAADNKDKSMKDSSWSQSKSDSSGNIQRINKDSLQRQVTANDIIGASVVDEQGEKIGDITDISIRGLVSESTAAGIKQSEVDSDEPINQDEESASSRMGDMMSRMTGGSGSQATAFISVGGLFGVGDDIVGVPLEDLRYDQQQDNFVLSTPKDEVVALAEQEAQDYEEAYSDWGGSDSDYSAKQEFDSEAGQIRQAIREDTDLRLDPGIMVSAEDDEIVLEGVVSSEESKQRAEEIAKQHTDKDVKNSLKVKKDQ